MLKQKRKVLIGVILACAIMLTSVGLVSAASITPSTNSALIGAEARFTVTGLLTTDTFYVELGGVEILSDLVPTSAGVLSFSVSSSTAGTFLVAVYNSTDVLQCSAQLVVSDLMAQIIPYLGIMIGIVILFGIVKELKF